MFGFWGKHFKPHEHQAATKSLRDPQQRFNKVQAAGEVARKKQRATVKTGGQRVVIGADSTYVRVKEEPTGLEIVVADDNGGGSSRWANSGET